MSTNEKTIEYTPWITFIWAIGILSTLFFIFITMCLSAKAESSEAIQLTASQKELQTVQLDFIKEQLTRIEKKIDSK